MPIYALFLAGLTITMLALNHYYKFRILSRWAGFLAGFFVVSVPFLVWDYIATQDGHWAFNAEYILGPKLFGLPIEEILFFILVPMMMVVVWMLVRMRVKERRINLDYLYRPVLAVLVLSTFMAVYRPYTFTVLGVTTLFWIIFTKTSFFHSYRFLVFQFWLYLLFFLSNTLLTWPPVVTYADSAIMGLKIGAIPIEDFFYNFVLINGFIIAYAKAERIRT